MAVFIIGGGAAVGASAHPVGCHHGGVAVTLNISVVAPHFIMQSSDFRVSNQNGEMQYIKTTKSVVISCESWTGLLTYTGIALDSNLRTSTAEVLSSWVGELEQDYDLEDFLQHLERRVEVWRLRFPGINRHTFTLLSITKHGEKHVTLLSNFQSLFRRDAPAQPMFKRSTRRVRGRAHVLVTGYTSDPDQRELGPMVLRLRRELKKVIKSNDNPKVTREFLYKFNLIISDKKPNIVSEDCCIISVLSNGDLSARVFGSVGFNPQLVFSNIGINEVLRRAISNSPGFEGAQIVSMASINTSFRPQIAYNCEPDIVNDGSYGYKLWILEHEKNANFIPVFRNESGTILGRMSTRDGDGGRLCFWKHGILNVGNIYDAKQLDPRWISNEDEIYINYTNSKDQREVIYFVPDPYKYIVMPAPTGVNFYIKHGSGAFRCGWLESNCDGIKKQRPAIWNRDTKSCRLLDADFDSGFAAFVNNSGNALCQLNFQGRSEVWVWDGESEVRLPSPFAEPGVLLARSISDDGSVIVEYRSGALRGLFSPRGVYRPIFMFEEWISVHAVNPAQLAAGVSIASGTHYPWVKHPNEPRAAPLPSLLHHNHTVTGVTSDGHVIGFAASDYCCHPLLWKPLRGELPEMRGENQQSLGP